MPKLIAYVANLLIGGHEVTHLPNDSYVRDIIRFNCDGREFLFRQNLDAISSKVRSPIGTLCETTVVEVENVNPAELAEVLKTINAICWLLSFATQSRVVCYGHDYSDGTSLGYRQAVIGVANHFRPVFDFHDSEIIKNYIEQTYPNYKQLVEKRKLYAIFEYLYQAERATQPTEIRLLLLFISLENLKDTYAKEMGFPFKKGFYRKPPTPRNKDGDTYKFKELLYQMFQSVQMSKDLQKIKELRDEIVHSGLSHKSHSEQIMIYEEVQDLLREYLLKLLNFRGKYFLYSSQGMLSADIN